MKYSPDALDNVLYEPGEPAVLKNVASKKIKADMSKRPSINALSPFEISDYVVSMAKKSKKNLSYVEVEDFRPPTSVSIHLNPMIVRNYSNVLSLICLI